VKRSVVSVGIVGTGFGRFVHLPAFLALPNVQVVGIASAHPEKAQSVADANRLSHRFASWQELVSCEEIEAVSVATPPHANEAIVSAALNAGKAVLCEKPLANTASEAERLWRLAQRLEQVNMVDFEFRELSAWQFAHELLCASAIGDVRHVNIEWIMQNWSDASRPASWKTDAVQGGGILRSMVAHLFDYVEWFLGPISSISAHLTTRISQRPNAQGQAVSVDAEDCCHLLMQLFDGTPVSAVISAIAVQGKGHTLEFFGSHKTLRLMSNDPRDFGTGFEIWQGNGQGWERIDIPSRYEFTTEKSSEDGRIPPFLSLAKRFINAVETHDLHATPSFEHGYRTQKLIECAEQSQRERRWVDIGLT
jgi:predicted dehydrogenase